MKVSRARLESGRLGVGAWAIAAVFRRGLEGGQGRAEHDAPLGHQLEDLVVAAIAVLDGRDARQRRAAHPLLRRRMGRDPDADRARRLDDPLQFLQRERRPDRRAAHRGVGVDLDPVGPSADLVADDPDQGIDPVGLLGALGDVPLGGEPLGRVAAGGHDRPGDDQHPRAGDDPLVHGLLQPDVGIAGPFGPQVADRREAGSKVLFR